MSARIFSTRVRNYILKEWYFTDESTPPESGASTSPTYATQTARSFNAKLQ
jgi:hypothetical protein